MPQRNLNRCCEPFVFRHRAVAKAITGEPRIQSLALVTITGDGDVGGYSSEGPIQKVMLA